MPDLREELEAALPEELQPVGAALRMPPDLGGRITGYGALIIDALLPVIRQHLAAACDNGAANAYADALAQGDFPHGLTMNAPNPWKEP